MSSVHSPLLTPSQNGLAALTLRSPNGSTAQVYAYGAQVTSWRAAGKGEQLFVSRNALFTEGSAIRGGVPVIFPQFGAFGPGTKHGFARNLAWQFNVEASNSHTAVFTLTSNTTTLAAWPFQFAANYTVTLGDNHLHLTLSIQNIDNKTFEFTGALHTYFAVDELQQTAINGLTGLNYWDNGTVFSERKTQRDEQLLVREAIDRVYFSALAPVELQQPNQTLRIDSQGFADIVVWNPGAQGAAALADFADDEFAQMLCIESAAVEKPIVLQPVESWSGAQLLQVN